jgi:HPt (histidine-containing phosphotransfer) domain-containing protein
MTIVYEIDKDLEEIVPAFLEGRKKDTELIKKFVLDKNFEELRSIGHKLKGTAGSYGFMGLSKIGAQIEEAAKASNIDALNKLSLEYENHIKQVEVKFV